MKYLLAALALFSAVAVASPSFDCKQASHEAEKSICNSQKLSYLDSLLASTYKQHIASQDAEAKNEKRAEQREWIGQRNAACVVSEQKCWDVIAERIAALGKPYSNVIIKSVAENAEPYIFRLSRSYDFNSISKVRVSNIEGALIQEFAVESDFDNGMISFVDINFDGHLDLLIPEFRTAGPNIPFLVFIFNQTNKKFEASSALDNVTSPEFDAEHKVVTSMNRSNVSSYTHSYYRWQRNILVKVLSETHECIHTEEGGGCFGTIRDGSGAVLSRKRISEGDPMCTIYN